MATKPILPTLSNTGNIQTQLTTINNGYRQIEDEFEKMLSREDNSLPNHMLDALDMDGNKVINVADGTEGADAVNKSQLDTKEDLLGNPPATGMVLASTISGDRYWTSDLSVLSATLTVAPQDARYVVVTSNPLLTNESVLTVGSNLTITDNTSSIQIDALVDPIDHLDFDTTPTTTSAVGRLVWNDAEGTLDLGVKGGNIPLHLGQKQLIRVVNKTASNLLATNYQVVKISGAQGQRPKIALAQANNDANSADTIGLINENINNNQEGFVCTSGIVSNINTTGSLQGETWLDGDVLYLSGTTAGALTNIKPAAPIHTVIVGFVIYAHANNGKIYVKVDNGYELDELHNVLISSPTNAQVLSYESATGLWKNTTPAGGGGTTTFAATFNNGGAGAASGTTFDGSVARTISYNTLGAAPLASPTFTGIPAGPTAAVTTNTTQLATTAFVNAEIANDAVTLTGNQTVAGTKTFSSTISGSITGNAGTATTLQTGRTINAVTFNGSADITVPRVRALDDRTIAPADGSANYVTAYFTSWANNNTSPYADSLLFRTWGDGTAGNDNLLMLRRDTLGMRVWQQTFGSATAFATFKDVAWTDGTNATGTWTINTSGNAGTVTNGVYTTGNQTIAGDKTFSGTTALASTSTIGGAVIGYRDVPVTISNATYTFALADAGKAFGKDNGTAYTYTIPANGAVAFPVGTVITVFNNNATSNITIAITTDTLRLAGTTTTGSRTVAPFSLCTLFKVASTVWLASGAGVT